MTAWQRGALVLLLCSAGPATADAPPPAGRYRCYQPPDYAVVSWFDFEADGTYRLQGAASARYAWDARNQRVRWLDGEHARQRLTGIYLPPSASQGPRRHTIVLAKEAAAKPGSSGWNKLPQCYLTEH